MTDAEHAEQLKQALERVVALRWALNHAERTLREAVQHAQAVEVARPREEPQ